MDKNKAHKIKLLDGRTIAYGFDLHKGGYFADLFENDGKIDHWIESTGFHGVNKDRVLEFFEKHDAVTCAREQTAEAFGNLCMDLPC